MTIEQTMEKSGAKSEFAPFQRNPKYTGSHPRPRIGATVRKRIKQAKQQESQQQ